VKQAEPVAATATATNGGAEPPAPEPAIEPEPAAPAPAEPPATPPGSFSIGRPATTAWREQALARVGELRTLTTWLVAQPGVDQRTVKALETSVDGHLKAAKEAAKGDRNGGWWSRRKAWLSGAEVERAMSNTEAVEADLIRLAPLTLLRGAMPSLVVTVEKHLPPTDRRRIRLEEIARSKEPLTETDRETIVRAVRGATSEGRREVTRVRSFRNVLFVTAGMLTVVALVIGFIGIKTPTTLPICFAPDNATLVCPTEENSLKATGGDAATGQEPVVAPSEIDEVTAKTANPWDVPLIEMLGLVAAAVAAAAALRSIRGTSTPYSLPVALAVLKLPTGALTALLGLLLMRGNFVPGLSALDSSAQIVAWAIIFGYAQQLLTRMVDQQAHSVLEDVGGSQKNATSSS
jgi:hypothetical protein